MSNSKKPKVECSNNPDIWMKWFEELEDDNDGYETNDRSESEAEDHVSQSEHDTNSEEEAGESDQNENVETDDDDGLPASSANSNQPTKFFMGKDGTKWSGTCPNRNTRTRSRNIMKIHLPGPKGIARETKTEIEIWNLFFDDAVINTIVHCTNIYIDKIRNNFEREQDASYTDAIEIRAFIGLLYLIGSLRSSRKNLHSLWNNSKGNGLESCYLTMSEVRFRFLIRCLRFDNVMDRNARKEFDKLAPIREVSELLVNNFQKYFSPSEYLTVDEQLLAFRGRCSFRQYIPSKPAKYGMKVLALVDSKTAYTCNLEVYVGKQPEGPYQLSNSAEEVVLRLVEPVSGSNRNITGDNWFTSVSLAKRLLQEKQLTYVGTIRKNKREIPREFLPNKNRAENSSLFGFETTCSLVSYCPKKNKSVLVLSTMHDTDDIDESTGDKKKPDVVTFYNMTKVGVDLLDQLCQKNDVARNSRRWPMVLFYNLVNISAINALCVYKYHHQFQKISRVDFLKI